MKKCGKISFVLAIFILVSNVFIMPILAIEDEHGNNHEYIEDYFVSIGYPEAGEASISPFALFPLSLYPDGSFYSYDGKACTCHGWCNHNSSCNCIKYSSSTQCAAFAKYIYKMAKLRDYNEQGMTTKNVSLTSGDVAKTHLGTLTQGTYIRVLTKPNADNKVFEHSIAVMATSSTHITIYHANYGDYCQVRWQEVTWADFAKAFTYLYFIVV